MRIGILGGSFDPIHLGHLIVAETACEELSLDRLLFVLAPSPPHKQDQTLAPATHRLAMLELALSCNPRFAPSTIEWQRPGPAYTVDTLAALKAQPDYGDARFYFIIGMDSLVAFHNWRDPEGIMQIATLVVYPRAGFRTEDADQRFSERCHFLRGPLVEVSATEIRQWVRTGRSIRYWIPESVRAYIEANRLYRE